MRRHWAVVNSILPTTTDDDRQPPLSHSTYLLESRNAEGLSTRTAKAFLSPQNDVSVVAYLMHAVIL